MEDATPNKFMSIDGFAVVVVSVHHNCRRVAIPAARAVSDGCRERPSPKSANHVKASTSTRLLTRKKESPLETQLKEEGLGIVRHRFVCKLRCFGVYRLRSSSLSVRRAVS